MDKEGSHLATPVYRREDHEWVVCRTVHCDIRWHHPQKEFGKNIPVVSTVTVEQPGRLKKSAVEFCQQPDELEKKKLEDVKPQA